MVIKRPGARELCGESAAFGDRPASSMSKYSPAWTLTSEMVPFGSKSVTLSMYIDAGDDLHGFDRINWTLTSEMFTFLEMLAVVTSENSFGAFVCARRPAGLHRNSSSCWPQVILMPSRFMPEVNQLTRPTVHLHMRTELKILSEIPGQDKINTPPPPHACPKSLLCLCDWSFVIHLCDGS